jgi:hypothetical protein
MRNRGAPYYTKMRQTAKDVNWTLLIPQQLDILVVAGPRTMQFPYVV